MELHLRCEVSGAYGLMEVMLANYRGILDRRVCNDSEPLESVPPDARKSRTLLVGGLK